MIALTFVKGVTARDRQLRAFLVERQTRNFVWKALELPDALPMDAIPNAYHTIRPT